MDDRPKPGILRITIPKPQPPKPFDKVSEAAQWKTEASRLLALDDVSPDLRAALHTQWTVEGHRIREQIGDDVQLAALLRHALPKYIDGDVTLYRGENLDRLNAGKIGLCWTGSEDTAHMFGAGLNAIRSGGVLLKINAKAAWIIAGPSSHSEYLGENEYTLDPQMISDIEIIRRYSSSDRV